MCSACRGLGAAGGMLRLHRRRLLPPLLLWLLLSLTDLEGTLSKERPQLAGINFPLVAQALRSTAAACCCGPMWSKWWLRAAGRRGCACAAAAAAAGGQRSCALGVLWSAMHRCGTQCACCRKVGMLRPHWSDLGKLMH